MIIRNRSNNKNTLLRLHFLAQHIIGTTTATAATTTTMSHQLTTISSLSMMKHRHNYHMHNNNNDSSKNIGILLNKPHTRRDFSTSLRIYTTAATAVTASRKHQQHQHQYPVHTNLENSTTTKQSSFHTPPAGIAFKYGTPDFVRVCQPGIFHVDRTHYIPLLEQSGDVLSFLRPRRMGKSVLLSMLENYYNVLRKDQFDQLFGHLWIGQHPTQERNSYLIMDLDFSNLDTSNGVEAFEKSLRDKINRAVVKFKNAYQHLLPSEIVINKDNAIDTFESMTDAVSESAYRSKLYILIDEYDNSVNKALSDMKQALYTHLFVSPEETNGTSMYEQKKEETARKDSTFRRFFTTVKAQMRGGGVGRVFITGVSPIALNDFTSGFNIATHLTHDVRFSEMCGLTESEVRRGLEQIAGLSAEQVDHALQTMREQYDGLLFHPHQKNHLYNTTLAIHFMRYLASHGVEPMGRKLVDHNVNPSESVLNVVSKTPLVRKVIDDLYAAGNTGDIFKDDDVSDTLSTKKMLDLLLTSEQYVLSFLYYMGALTQGPLPEGKHMGTVYRIPNEVTRKEFIDVLKDRLQWTESTVYELQKAVTKLIDHHDIGQLCEQIQEHCLSHLQSNDVVHSGEQDVKVAFMLALNLSGRSVQTENEFSFFDADNVLRYADLMLSSPCNVHIEFKNVKMDQLVPVSMRDWSKKCDEARRLDVQLTDQERMKHPLTKHYDSNHLKRKMTTVQDVWDDLVLQTRSNKMQLEHQLGRSITSFAVLRIGLYTLKHEVVE